MTVQFYPFGPKIYSYGLVHYATYDDDLACGDYSQYGPPMMVHKDEPVTCLHCVVTGDPRRNA